MAAIYELVWRLERLHRSNSSRKHHLKFHGSKKHSQPLEGCKIVWSMTVSNALASQSHSKYGSVPKSYKGGTGQGFSRTHNFVVNWNWKSSFIFLSPKLTYTSVILLWSKHQIDQIKFQLGYQILLLHHLKKNLTLEGSFALFLCQ